MQMDYATLNAMEQKYFGTKKSKTKSISTFPKSSTMSKNTTTIATLAMDAMNEMNENSCHSTKLCSRQKEDEDYSPISLDDIACENFNPLLMNSFLEEGGISCGEEVSDDLIFSSVDSFDGIDDSASLLSEDEFDLLLGI